MESVSFRCVLDGEAVTESGIGEWELTVMTKVVLHDIFCDELMKEKI